MGMKVIVGSKNPVKVNAVKKAFEKVWPEEVWNVIGESVSSGVADQPMSDLESITGASNRARACQELHVDAEFTVGLEGGLSQIGGEWYTTGWVVILDKDGVKGSGSSVNLLVPPIMISEVHQGKEIGDICDMFFKTKNAKHDIGQFGLMTNAHVTRESAYVDAVVIALSRFLHQDLYERNA